MGGEEKQVGTRAASAPVKVEDCFFTDETGVNRLFSVFEGIPRAAEPLREIRSVFESNLLNALLTASSFLVFARQMAYGAGCHGMLGVLLGTHVVVGAPLEENVRRARELLNERLAGPEWRDKLAASAERLAMVFLGDFVADEMRREVSARILNQCAILAWSALEVLASDLFVRLLNAKPCLAGVLFREERTRQLFRAKDLGDALEEHGYDLSGRMGQVLLQQSRLDTLGKIKDVYGVLFGDSAALMTALGQPELWRFYKVRNVIVHRGGVVDEQFLRDAGAGLAVGDKFWVGPNEFESFLILAAGVGAELLNAASASLS